MKSITKYEYDEKGRMIKRIIDEVIQTFTYEENPDGGYIMNTYVAGDLKVRSIFDNHNNLIEENRIFDNSKTINEYDDKDNISKSTIYRDGEEECHFTHINDYENSTETIIGDDKTVVWEFIKDSNDELYCKEYPNSKPYTSNITEENCDSIDEYIYNDDKTKVTVNMKNKEGKTTLIYKIDRYFCEAINDYLDSKIVCILPDGNTIATSTFKYNDKGLVIESIDK